jgi:hypothetical protein
MGIPSRDLSFRDRIISYTGNMGLIAASTARELLVTAVLAKTAAIAGAHVAEVTALANLA